VELGGTAEDPERPVASFPSAPTSISGASTAERKTMSKEGIFRSIWPLVHHADPFIRMKSALMGTKFSRS